MVPRKISKISPNFEDTMLRPKYMNPGFNLTNQCTLPVQTITESYRVLHSKFAEILMCIGDQFLTSRKVETPLNITCSL